jgi:ABC-type cobalamin/Fe3+-siderophores transport system ATPase subunit
MPLLSVENVSKAYESGPRRTPVLREATLSIEPGECMAVWGQRASGKTTLLKVAAGLLTPDLGTVRFKDRDIHRAASPVQLLGEQIGWARGAGPEADGLEALDYVALSLLESDSLRHARRESWEALACVGIAQRARTRCECLSNTERALMSIAHAIVRRPSLLLADEPAAQLGAAEREPVMGLLRALAEERSLGVLLTVSDIPSLVQAHRVASLSEGWLLAPQAVPPPHDNVLEFPNRSYAIR